MSKFTDTSKGNLTYVGINKKLHASAVVTLEDGSRHEMKAKAVVNEDGTVDCYVSNDTEKEIVATNIRFTVTDV